MALKLKRRLVLYTKECTKSDNTLQFSAELFWSHFPAKAAVCAVRNVSEMLNPPVLCN